MARAAKKAENTAITPYAMIGGQAGLKRIVARFYEIMDSDPAASGIRAMHGRDLGPVRERLFEFLSGWLGGPPLYFQRTDSRCVVSAHSAYAIGEAERDQWLYCMRRALEEEGLAPEVRTYLDGAFFRLADFIRNR
jgi:hemoglobin